VGTFFAINVFDAGFVAGIEAKSANFCCKLWGILALVCELEYPIDRQLPPNRLKFKRGGGHPHLIRARKFRRVGGS
jgi:hypothetical protein